MVYLLCFNKKFKHAKHYIGFAENQRTFEIRLEHHKKGRGAKLMDAITKAGIGFTVSRTWPDGDRNFERKLKNRKKSSQICPHCIAAKKAEKACPIVQASKPIDMAMINDTVKRLDLAEGKKPEVPNAQSQSPAIISRWRRIWNSLARLFTVQETDSVSK